MRIKLKAQDDTREYELPASAPRACGAPKITIKSEELDVTTIPSDENHDKLYAEVNQHALVVHHEGRYIVLLGHNLVKANPKATEHQCCLMSKPQLKKFLIKPFVGVTANVERTTQSFVPRERSDYRSFAPNQRNEDRSFSPRREDQSRSNTPRSNLVYEDRTLQNHNPLATLNKLKGNLHG